MFVRRSTYRIPTAAAAKAISSGSSRSPTCSAQPEAPPEEFLRLGGQDAPLALVLADLAHDGSQDRPRLVQRQVRGNGIGSQRGLPHFQTGDRRQVHGAERPGTERVQGAVLDIGRRAESEELRVEMDDLEGDPPLVGTESDSNRVFDLLPGPQVIPVREGNRGDFRQLRLPQRVVPVVFANQTVHPVDPAGHEFRPERDRPQQRGLSRVVRPGDHHRRGDPEHPVPEIPEVPGLDFADQKAAPGRLSGGGSISSLTAGSGATGPEGRRGGVIPTSRRRGRRPVCRSRPPLRVPGSRGRRTPRGRARRRSLPR